MDINQVITGELGVKRWQVDAAVKLIDEGNTIPFIARYRKEVTGTLDDAQLRTLHERLMYLRNLEEKKEQDAADNDISDEITDSEKADNAELTDASENTQDKADNVTDDNNNQVSDIKNPDTMDTKASEKTYEKDNRKKEYSTEIKKVSRKLKKGFEAADMHVDIII